MRCCRVTAGKAKTLFTMKKLLSFLCVLLLAAGAQAATVRSQADPQRLVVWLTDGSKVYHDLADEPTTTFADGSLLLTTAKTSISYPLDKVLRYTYEGVYSSISAPTLQPGEVFFSQEADGMTFAGLPAGTLIQLFSPDGKLLGQQTAAEGQKVEVSANGMPAGTYIVKAGDATYKFLKK